MKDIKRLKIQSNSQWSGGIRTSFMRLFDLAFVCYANKFYLSKLNLLYLDRFVGVDII